MDYTNYDYQALVDRITEVYRSKEGIGDGYSSSTGQTLIELLADTNDHLFYMLERRVQEAFMETARLESSVWSHASEIGYRPTRAVAASGTLSLCVLDSDNKSTVANSQITIPKGTKITGDLGGGFVTTTDVLISAGEGQANIPVKQGVEEVLFFDFSDPDSLARQESEVIIEDYLDIDEYSIQVTEGNEEYTDIRNPSDPDFVNITSLNFASKNDALYDIFYSKEGMRIVFGDGVFGKQPRGGVRVKFLRTEGNNVAYMTKGNKFQLESDTIDADFISAIDSTVYKYDIINITEIQGGKTHEGIQSIKEFAPAFTRTANRAVTSTDYEFWAEKSGIGDIVDVKAYGEHETGDIIFTMNNVYISYLTSSGLPLNTPTKSNLRSFLERRKTLTHHLVISEANKINILANLKIRKNRLFPVTNAHFYDIIKRKMEEYFFDLIETESGVKYQSPIKGSIGRNLQHSEFVKYLQDSTFILNGIEYDITDYVRLDLEGEYELVMPPEVFEVSFRIDSSYTPNNSDTFILRLGGQLFQETISSSDEIYDILSRMRDKIFLESDDNYLVALDGEGDDALLFVRSRSRDEIFSVEIQNGTISEYVNYNVIHQIPAPDTDISIENKLLPSSVSIVNSSGDVLYVDDGNGTMIPTSGASGEQFEVEYDKSRINSPRILVGENESYFVRFQQNDFMNFRGNYKTAVTMSPIADNISDTPLKSKITIIDRD